MNVDMKCVDEIDFNSLLLYAGLLMTKRASALLNKYTRVMTEAGWPVPPDQILKALRYSKASRRWVVACECTGDGLIDLRSDIMADKHYRRLVGEMIPYCMATGRTWCDQDEREYLAGVS